MIRPVCSAIGTNSLGPTMPNSGWFQRASASTPTILAGPQVGLGLVVERDLALVDGRAHAAGQRQAARRVAVELRLEDRVAAAGLLGRVHGDVGALLQRLDVVAVHAGAGRCRRWRRSPAACPRARTARAAPPAAAGRRAPRPGPWRRCGSSTPNSSPPRRATVSASRSAALRRRDTSCSSRSPWWWPSVSLISLKWSRSMIITTAVSPERRDARIACSIRSRNRSRFGSPVSASWSAWCSLAIASLPPRCTANSGRNSSAMAGSAKSAASSTTGARPRSRPAVGTCEERSWREVA